MISKNEIASEDQYIDLNLILKLIIFFKKFIFKTTAIGAAIGIIFAFNTKRIWEGQFQIVLNVKSNNFESGYSNLVNLGFLNKSTSNDLNTQVEILRSPSVLMPIFEFAKTLENEKESKSLNFKSWKKNLNIKLKEGTKVLNISYKNKNKNFIIPALDKLSNSYKFYSAEKNRKELSSIINFLEKEIALYSNKSRSSFEELQTFAIENNLSLQNPILDKNISSPTKLDNSKSFSTYLEDLKIKLHKLEKNNINQNEIEFISASIPEIRDEGLIEELGILDKEIYILSSKFQKNDKEIIKLNKRKESIQKFIKERSITFLKGKIEEAEISKEASNSSKEIILKFRELIRKSAKDDLTFNNLDDNLRKYKIERSRGTEPWMLITKPTLLDYQVGRSRKKITLLFSGLGFLTGTLISFLRKKKNGIIIDDMEITEILKSEPLETISTKKDSSLMELKLIIASFLNNLAIEEKLLILLPNSQDEDMNQIITLFLNSNFDNKRIIFSTDPNDLNLESNIILMIKKDIINLKVLDKIKNSFLITNRKIIGWVSVKD
tara:strand:- start:506 stop:2155 length:1650 start_codon:yes stop_codon:yes gene_type:complete